MDTVTPPASTLQSHNVSPVLKIIAIATVVLAVIISVVAYTPLFYKGESSETPVVFGIPIGPLPSLYTLTTSSNGKPSYIPLKVASTKETSLPVVDILHSNTSQFYLLLESTSTTNIYQKQAGTFTRITTSSSFKKNISYDPTSGMFAYQISGASTTPNASSEIVTFNPKTKVETKTGVVAVRSVILPGGKDVLGIHDKTIDHITLESGKHTSILNIYSPYTVAVKADASEITIFEPQTKALQIYTYSPGTGVSFVKATAALPGLAVAVSYVGNDVYAVYNDVTSGVPTYVFEDLTNEKTVRIPNVIPQFPLNRFVYE